MKSAILKMMGREALRSFILMTTAIFFCFGQTVRVAASNGEFAFVKNASTAPMQTEQFDYIIIGGGTAGCPLAATLSQNYSVLLLERGGAPFNNPNVQSVVNFARVLTDSDDSSTSPTQGFQSEDGVLNRRARVLGGGTSVNAGFYGRAESDWIGDRGFNQGRVNDSYEWVEKFMADFPQLGPWQTAVRDGLLEVGVTPDNGNTYHHLSGTKVGGTIFDRVGRRRTAADLLQYANSANIQVLLYASAHQITFSSDRTRPLPAATGVVYSDELGIRHQAFINAKTGSEIILSAGAIGSPQLLLLSGIGPATHLTNLSIPIVLDQPAVGQKITDNPAVTMLIPSRQPLENSLTSTTGILPIGFYIEAFSGLTTAFDEMNSLNTLSADYRSRDVVQNFTSMIPEFPQVAKSIIEQAGVLRGKLATPASRGYLKLKSTNVRDNPLVRFNYFAEPEDLFACVEGVRVMQAIVRSRALAEIMYPTLPDVALTWAGYVAPLAPETGSTNLLSQWCRNAVLTAWNFHGGCQEGVVVDKGYKVLGLDAIRVIDGSTFNSSPGTNPQATIMMLGRYMGLTILEERTRMESNQ